MQISKKALYRLSGGENRIKIVAIGLLLVLLCNWIFGDRVAAILLFCVLCPWALYGFAISRDGDYQDFRCKEGDHLRPIKKDTIKLEGFPDGSLWVTGECPHCGKSYKFIRCV